VSDPNTAPNGAPWTHPARQPTLACARAVVGRAIELAAESGLRLAVVVVDAAGHPVAAERMDGAPFVAMSLAQEKAWTAAAFGAPTTLWRESSRPGGIYWGLTSAVGGRISALAGGAPVRIGGELVGGVGVSGGDDGQDERCARLAAEYAETAPRPRPTNAREEVG
jgi:uncharacterized protein GlcG (DUF336 family)